MATLDAFRSLVDEVFAEANLVSPSNFQQAFFAAIAEMVESIMAVYSAGKPPEKTNAFLAMANGLGHMAEAMFAASGEWNRTNSAKERFDKNYLLFGSMLARKLDPHVDSGTAKQFAKEVAQTMMMLLLTWDLYAKAVGIDEPLDMIDNILTEWAKRHKKKPGA